MRFDDYPKMAARFEAMDLRVQPPTPEQIDVASGRIRRYGHGPFHCEIEPQSHGSLALWHVVAPPLAAMLICAWVREWTQPQVGAQLELL